MLPFLVIYLIKSPVQFAKGVLLSFILFMAVHIPFGLPLNPSAIFNFYIYTVREISGYVSSNAFNFWGVTHGFGPITDNINWFGTEAFYWGLTIMFLMMVYFVRLALKNSDEKVKFFLLTLFSYSSFLFLTRMHERYFYLMFILLVILYGLFKKLKWVLLAASFVFTVNLYHYWWVPGGDLLKYFLSARAVEIMFCLANLLLFFYLERFREKMVRKN